MTSKQARLAKMLRESLEKGEALRGWKQIGAYLGMSDDGARKTADQERGFFECYRLHGKPVALIEDLDEWSGKTLKRYGDFASRRRPAAGKASELSETSEAASNKRKTKPNTRAEDSDPSAGRTKRAA